MEEKQKRDAVLDNLSFVSNWSISVITLLFNITDDLYALKDISTNRGKYFGDRRGIPAWPETHGDYDSTLRYYTNAVLVDGQIHADKIQAKLKEAATDKRFKAALWQLKLANAYHLDPLEFHDNAYHTSIEAIFAVGKYVTVIFEEFKSISKKWEQDKDDSNLFQPYFALVSGRTVNYILDEVPQSLLEDLSRKQTTESYQCSRWIFDLCGYPDGVFQYKDSNDSKRNDKRYPLQDAYEALSLSTTQFNKYRREAGIESQGKGYEMPESDLIIIASHIFYNSSASQRTKRDSRRFLDEVGHI
ncbi:hypothetical protein GmarT_13810 [Gimesia maris]|uniref:DUF5636 domain-containing protein n=2 Tax=Gimesia maris TaxID=122 RepID=A0ABX5YIU5_9PLAN|nr:hypothetical protein GmarT_13810 [Gimesia maris]